MLFRLFVFLFSIQASAALHPRTHSGWNARTLPMMGSYLTVSLPEQHLGLIPETFEVAKSFNKKFNSQSSDSEIAQLNALRTLKLSAEATEAINIAKSFHHLTHGYFDFTMGALLKEKERKKIWRQPRGAKFVQVKGRSAWIKKKGVEIDLGGIEKGLAVDTIARHWISRRLHQGRIEIGNDFRCFDLCEFSIFHPKEKKRLLGLFRARNPHISVSTSSRADSLNPHTRRKSDSFAQLTLISHANNTRVDALSTALSVMPLWRAKKFLRRRQDIAYILVENDGTVAASPNLESFVATQQEKSELLKR